MMTPEERVRIREDGFGKAVVVATVGDAPRIISANLTKGWAQRSVDDIRAAITEAEADAKADELNRCCKAIRAECIACSGSGIGGVDADEEANECVYCGRPIAAIRKPPAESEVPE